MVGGVNLSNSAVGRLVRGLFSGTPDHPLLKKNHQNFADLDQNKPLADYEFVVVDTELTGLNPKRDEIVSIGAVRIRDLRIDPKDSFYSLVHPRMDLPKLSTLIHRITPEEVRDKPRLHTVLPRFVEFCNGALIVGHHIGLDMSFLNRVCKKVFGGTLMNPCLDTMRMAQVFQEENWSNYYEQYRLDISYNLNALAKRYGLPEFHQHNAFQDAMQTAYLFLYLVKKLRKGNISTLRDLYDAGRSWRWYY
jgi:DNA polymerase-3 subunit epsilon